MTTVKFGSNTFIELFSREVCDYNAVYPAVDAVIRPFVCQKARGNPEIWDDLLHKACSLRSKPESTLAFLYNRVVVPLETEHNKKGDNKAVQMRFNGQPLGKIREQLEQDLSHALGREIPSAVLAPLDQNLQGHEADLFLLSTRQIATASYTVANALSAAHERELTLDLLSETDKAAHGLTKNSFFFDNPWAASLYRVSQAAKETGNHV